MKRKGFTLIELLVVVAIIAVLISILLPSLSGARRLAKRVVCGSGQRQIAIAATGYGLENDDWIVGAPNGSGIPAFGPGSALTYRDAPTTPWDWATPLRERYMKDSGINYANTIGRMAQTREGVFRCPETSDVTPLLGGPPAPHDQWNTQLAPSFLISWKFLLVGRNYAGLRQGTFKNSTPGSGEYPVDWQVAPSGWESEPPRDYLPRISKVGPPSRKFFLLDGMRFIEDSGRFSLWARANAIDGYGVGNFASSGTIFNRGREYGTQFDPGGDPELNLKKSYRHRNGKDYILNASFFDGHVEVMTEKQTRYHGFALPSGSFLRSPGQLEAETLSLLQGWDADRVLPD
ncbi:MAG: type II secretion system protein [Phycisphaerae bacterium]|nr:type II secretion system protein [Phycisphaerae bacterium]